MTNPHTSTDAVRERAAQWVMQLNDQDLNDAQRETLHAWLLESPAHEREFRAHQAFIGLAHELPPDLLARLNAYVPVIHQEKSSGRRRWMASLAAAVLVAVSAGSWYLSQKDIYETRTGENRTVTFDDGSVAYLNTRTRLKWLGSEGVRRVALSTGEVLFDVAYDPAHPFRVVIGNTEIQVLGTRFNVYRKPSGEVTVTVLEGKVAVRALGDDGPRPAWQRELTANQRLVYRPLGLMRDVEATVAADAVNWRQGKVTLEEGPLPEALEEFTRYTDQRIVFQDPHLATMQVGGVFNIRDVRIALSRLEKIAPIHVVQSGDTFTLEYRTNNEEKRTF